MIVAADIAELMEHFGVNGLAEVRDQLQSLAASDVPDPKSGLFCWTHSWFDTYFWFHFFDLISTDQCNSYQYDRINHVETHIQKNSLPTRRFHPQEMKHIVFWLVQVQLNRTVGFLASWVHPHRRYLLPAAGLHGVREDHRRHKHGHQANGRAGNTTCAFVNVDVEMLDSSSTFYLLLTSTSIWVYLDSQSLVV